MKWSSRAHRRVTRAAGFLSASDFEKAFGDGPVAEPQVINPPTLANPLAGVARASAGEPAYSEYEAVPLDSTRHAARGIFLTSGVLAVVSARCHIDGDGFLFGSAAGKIGHSLSVALVHYHVVS